MQVRSLCSEGSSRDRASEIANGQTGGAARPVALAPRRRRGLLHSQQRRLQAIEHPSVAFGAEVDCVFFKKCRVEGIEVQAAHAERHTSAPVLGNHLQEAGDAAMLVEHLPGRLALAAIGSGAPCKHFEAG